MLKNTTKISKQEYVKDRLLSVQVAKTKTSMQVHISCSSFFKVSGIYFLRRNRKIVYIGESSCLISRIISHKNTKDFDSFSFIVFNGSSKNRKIREAKLIARHNPEYNILHKYDKITKQPI